ncbi:MAG: hypothetical protein ACKVT0_12255, partial [Planctomycetaceae bacterium]
MFIRTTLFSLALMFACCTSASAQSRQAPPGMFKDLDDEILSDALIVHGTQLFIDDDLIGDMQGLRKQLNQPVKYENNPVLKRDKPWENSGPGYATIIYDAEEKLFKVWYENWNQEEESTAALLYATSVNGIDWDKDLGDTENGTNL